MKRIVLFAVALAACAPKYERDITRPPDEIELDVNVQAMNAASLPPSGCEAAPPIAGAVRQEAHDLLNRIRRWRPGFFGTNGNSHAYQGQPCAAYLHALGLAATNHARYTSHWAGEVLHDCNVGSSHFERPGHGCDFFTGAWPPDRQIAAGLGWPYQPSFMSEVMWQRLDGAQNPHLFIQANMNSVYHRIPLLDRWTRGAGYGSASAPKRFHTSTHFTDVFNFAMFDHAVTIDGAHDRGLSMWPPPDSTGNFRSFDACSEGPSSPPHPEGCLIGVPISLVAPHFTPNGGANPDIRLFEWNPSTGYIRLNDVVILHDGNDPEHLVDPEYVIYQTRPLLPEKWYFVQGHGWHIPPGQPPLAGTLEWWFKTGG